MPRIKSSLKQAAGAIQETVGKAIGDPVMAAKGHMKTDAGLVEQGTLPADSKPGHEKPTFG